MTKQGTWAVLYCNTATAAGGTGEGGGGGGGGRAGQALGVHGAHRRACVVCGRSRQLGEQACRRAGHGRGAQRVRVAGGSRRATGARGLAKAVHSVHSACFWPGLTQYFS